MQPRGHYETQGSIIANAHGDVKMAGNAAQRTCLWTTAVQLPRPPPPFLSHDAGVMYRSVFEHSEGRKKQKPAVFLRSEKKQIAKPLWPQSSAPAAAWNASVDEGTAGGGGAHRDEQSFMSERMMTNRQTKRHEQKQHHLYIYQRLPGFHDNTNQHLIGCVCTCRPIPL